MSGFDFSTLITDRTNADVSALSALLSKKLESWTPEEVEKFNNGQLKGGYWWTDLNRVTACMEYLDAELRSLGYESGYVPVVVHEAKEPENQLLPDGYVELEYIESTGTQCIDTGIMPNQDTCFELSARVSLDNAGNVHIMSSNVPKYFALRPSYDYSSFAVRYGNDTALKNIQTDDVYSYHKFKRIKNNFYLDDNLGASSDYVTFQNTKTLTLGCLNSVQGYIQFCKAKYKYLKIWEYGKGLARCLVPCVNPSGKVGMYDSEEGKFYSNAGTGDFTAGTEVTIEQEPMDPYTWYESDIPTTDLMDRYLDNINAIREALAEIPGNPDTPATMSGLTYQKANDIEKILAGVETMLMNIEKTLNLGWAMGIADVGLYGGV